MFRSHERYHPSRCARRGPFGGGVLPKCLQPPIYDAVVYKNWVCGAENGPVWSPLFSDGFEPDFNVLMVYRADFVAAG